MKSLSRKESQVSRDFEATLQTVVKIFSRTDLIGSDKHSEHNISLRESRGSSSFKHSDSSQIRDLKKARPNSHSATFNQEINDWKSLNSLGSDCLLESPTCETSEQVCHLQTTEQIIPSQTKKQIIPPPDVIISDESEIKKRNGTAILQDNKLILNDKNNKKNALLSLFSTKEDMPFEGTDITNLSFSLKIIMKNDAPMLVTVYANYTIDKLKFKISKKKSLSLQEISLVYQNTRLEGHITLSWYNINSKSQVFLKILKKVEIFGRYMKTNCPILIYSSEKIIDIKTAFAAELKINPQTIHLKYKEIFLHDNKEMFLYDIRKGCAIDIIKRRMSISEDGPELILCEKSPGFELSQIIQTMTNELQCNCEEKRRNAMACGILSKFDRNFENHKCLVLLSEFTPNLHHKSCYKSRQNEPSENEQNEDSPQYVNRVRVLNVANSIHAEIDKMKSNKKIVIEQADLEYLCHANNFKSFKRFLRDKIGTKCTLYSVSLLYHYAQNLASFVNSKEDNPQLLNKIVKYITNYFVKYFQKSIILKGGLAELALENFSSED